MERAFGWLKMRRWRQCGRRLLRHRRRRKAILKGFYRRQFSPGVRLLIPDRDCRLATLGRRRAIGYRCESGSPSKTQGKQDSRTPKVAAKHWLLRAMVSLQSGKLSWRAALAWSRALLD